jgi:hypothetical protein
MMQDVAAFISSTKLACNDKETGVEHSATRPAKAFDSLLCQPRVYPLDFESLSDCEFYPREWRP